MNTELETPPAVSALFVREDSIYKTLGLDCWDIIRDARKYTGSNPVIVHPPCRAWGQLAHFAKPRPDEKELAFFAIQKVRECGGVLEHPRASKLFPAYLPLPGSIDEFGGYSLSIDQSWWGHKARKRTLLYIVGVPERELPLVPMNFDAIQYTISTSRRKGQGFRLKETPKKDREATPPRLAAWLIEVAQKCNLTGRTK